MARAYKLPNAAEDIVEIDAAQQKLNELQDKAFSLAASVGEGVTAAFRRRAFGSSSSSKMCERRWPKAGAT